ncbi:MAG: hypothetical protein M5U09_06950 [Gammaproteobacteria bacterium]|nr:hypothetical protein [Gammaproteobacteria bacterium]
MRFRLPFLNRARVAHCGARVASAVVGDHGGGGHARRHQKVSHRTCFGSVADDAAAANDQRSAPIAEQRRAALEAHAERRAWAELRHGCAEHHDRVSIGRVTARAMEPDFS